MYSRNSAKLLMQAESLGVPAMDVLICEEDEADD